MKVQFSLNDKVKIFPNEKGQAKMIEILAQQYKLPIIDAANRFDINTTTDGGYKEQLWNIIDLFSEIFTIGSPYFENSHLEIKVD